MTTHTADFGLRFETSPTAAYRPARAMPMDRSASAAAARPDWLTRLALWAERQPQHHRLGSWTLHR
jgi:hypothetical protein